MIALVRFAPDFAEEPGTGEGPFAIRGGFGNVENFSGFGAGESDEVAELNKTGFAFILVGELLEGFVESEEVV